MHNNNEDLTIIMAREKKAYKNDQKIRVNIYVSLNLLLPASIFYHIGIALFKRSLKSPFGLQSVNPIARL